MFLDQFLDNVYQEIGQGGACGLLFLDLTEAFDTFCLNVSMVKLRSIGFRPSTLSWL